MRQAVSSSSWPVSLGTGAKEPGKQQQLVLPSQDVKMCYGKSLLQQRSTAVTPLCPPVSSASWAAKDNVAKGVIQWVCRNVKSCPPLPFLSTPQQSSPLHIVINMPTGSVHTPLNPLTQEPKRITLFSSEVSIFPRPTGHQENFNPYSHQTEQVPCCWHLIPALKMLKLQLGL